jgi:hypothetical protein
MNSRVLSPILFIAGMFVALYVTVSVLMSEGNNVGAFCRWLLVGGLFLGVVSPRHAFYVFIIACGYNDLLKRMLVVGGRLQWGDVPYVLGITPVLFGGIVLGLVARSMTGSVKAHKRSVLMFIIATGLMLTSAILSALEKGGGGASTLKAMADDGVYAYLLFILPILFTTPDEIYRLFRFVLLVFLPVGLYGIYQHIFGFSDIEIAYLKSGFSIERWQLFSEAGRRSFSTLNSCTAYSVVCSALCLLSLYMGAWSRRLGIKPLIPPAFSWLIALIYFLGLMASSCRSPVLMLALGFLLGPWFETSKKTHRIYGAVFLGFFILVIASPILLRDLPYYMDVLTLHGEGGFYNWLERMTTVGTYSDRLMGFSNVLLNPSAYTLFGLRGNLLDSGDFYHHDPISRMLIRHGVIGLLAAFALIFVVARTMHRCVYEAKVNSSRLLAARFLGVAIAILVICAVGGNVLSTFPINVFFWLLLGACLLLGEALPSDAEKEAEDVVSTDLADTQAMEIQMAKGRNRLRPSRSIAQQAY